MKAKYKPIRRMYADHITTIVLDNPPPVTAKDFERIRDEISCHVLADRLPRSEYSADQLGESTERWQFQAQSWKVSCVATTSDVAAMLAKLKPFHHKRTEAAYQSLDAPVLTTPTANTRMYTQKQFEAALARTPELAALMTIEEVAA